MDTLCPYFVRLAHGYPYICVDNVCIFGSCLYILCESDGGTCLFCPLLTLCYKLIIREIFLIGAGYEIKTKLGAYNQIGRASCRERV